MGAFFTSPGATVSNPNNYIINPNAEIDTAYWNFYNNSGRTVPASVTQQDLTFTSALSGNAGNGVVVQYIYNASYPAATPNINVVSSSLVQVRWNNGPTIANNPTATQFKAAWDVVPTAVAIASCAISGTASDLQYINGNNTLANGGDTAPIDGTGGTPAGLVLTRNATAPLAGVTDFLFSKDATSRMGMGVSTDFNVDNKDRGNLIQISFVYDGYSGMVFGASSDIRVWIYDIVNAVLIPVQSRYTLTGPASTIVNFVGTFTAAPTSLNYRLIFHIGTANTAAWSINFDEVTATDIITPGAATQVPSLVLGNQPVSGLVTDHMCVMWRDGAAQWIPATISGSAIAVFGTDTTQLGFATNIISNTADIYISGAMDGFSFGPFVGYEQYLDNTAGLISPLPAPFTDVYVAVGKGISSTVLNIQFLPHVDLISNSSGVPLKGGLLTNSGVNTGTGDQVLAVGTNGTVPVANSAVALGIQWLAPIVATTPFTFTAATRTLTIAVSTNALAGVLSAADHTTYSGYAATIALKAPLASPVFTGDVNSSTGNVLISTLGKGVQVKTGTNSKLGTVALVAGVAVVANTSVTANSRIFLTSQTDGGTPGFLRVSAKVIGTSFTITSSNLLDTSTVSWSIIESIP